MNSAMNGEACQCSSGLRIAAGPQLWPLHAGWTQFHQRAVVHHDAGCEPVPDGKYNPASAQSHRSIRQSWVFETQVYHASAWSAISSCPEGRGFSRRFR
jgi:hypothetical protein